MILEDLSTDLLLSVANHLGHQDHKHLRLVCKSFAETFALLVLKSICIRVKPVIDGDLDASHLELLKWLSSQLNYQHRNRIQAIRKLSLTSLSPKNHEASYLGRESPTSGLPVSAAELNMQNAARMEDEVIRHLRPALLALENVHTFNWEVQLNDPQITHSIVAEVVSAYPQLETIHIYLPHLTTPVLHHFKNLVSIELSLYKTEDDRPIPDDVLSSCAQAIIQSPRLSIFGFNASEGKESLLDDILQRCGATNTIRSLQQLSLQRITSPLSTLPLIQNLKVIKMIDIVSEDGFAAAPFEEFWLAVKNMGVQLEHICVDRVPGSLVDYLKFHHGLQSFVLGNDTRAVINYPSDDDVATRFYLEGLSNHTATLEVLDLHLSYDDQWCYNPGLGRVIAQCVSLRRLGVGFKYSTQFDELSDTDSDQETPDVEPLVKTYLPNLLDIIAKNCRHMHSLNIYCPLPLTGRDIDSPQIHYYYRRWMWRAAEETLMQFAATYEDDTASSVLGHQSPFQLPTVYPADCDAEISYLSTQDGRGTVRYRKHRGVSVDHQGLH